MKLTTKQISEIIIMMADEDQKARSENNPDWKKIEIIDKKKQRRNKKNSKRIWSNWPKGIWQGDFK